MESSTMILKTSKDVEFQDLYYYVNGRRNYILEGEKRCLLNGVSGLFRNGQLSAIMGPSGAGKSSLLNAISGYRTSGVKGFVRINRRDSCYITQEDHHQSLLSVEELMKIACALKLNGDRDHKQIITEILVNLNLNHRRDTTADNLSGGERKRLSIALELVANPTTFFLDEPTSGLDEVTAAQCIRLLRSLAKEGRTIVCTIHQPSATIFSLFDQVFVLAKGQCVFQGEPLAIVPFLDSVYLSCPKHYSPSDYIIEVCDFDETGKNIPKLCDLIQNGKLKCVLTSNSSDEKNEETGRYQELIFRNACTSMILETPKNSRRFAPVAAGSALIERMKSFSKRMATERNNVSGFRQFCVLFWVMLVKISRNRIALSIQLFHHVLCGAMFGLIFYKSANKGERMFDHLKFCVGCILVIVYTQVMVPVLSYPFEVKLVKKEFFNRWYALMPYYFALTLSRIPFQIFFNLIFLSFTYWMAGLPAEAWRFGTFAAVGCITSFVAEGMGLFIGATFSVTNGSIVGPLLIAPFLGLAIYGFDFAADIPLVIYAIMKLSYIRVGAVTLVLTVFGFNRAELDCNDIYCHFKDPKVLLRFLRVENVSILHEFGYLLLLLVFFRTLLFISLRKRCRT